MKWWLVILAVIFFLGVPRVVQAAKRIEINLSSQQLFAYQDDLLVYNFLISSGKWSPTPTGTFYVYWKTPSTRMTGGNKALGTYYDLPGVPNTMFFYKGYAIHGAYWHNNFGVPMSHGCINVSVPNSKLVYDWTDSTTPIWIHY